MLWKRLYKKGITFAEHGTLSQLQSLINRTNVPLIPKNNVNAAEDFIQVHVQICMCMHNCTSGTHNAVVVYIYRDGYDIILYHIFYNVYQTIIMLQHRLC